MTYGSVASGIEAPSVAWEPLGWKPLWFFENAAFPSAVLDQRWPTVVNHGDMARAAGLISAGVIEAPDVFVGGTPCQSFSLAGLRGGMSDERGNLTLEFVRIADAIDDIRRDRGEHPTIVLWENVPGIQSDAGNAFGLFLAGLSGSDSPIDHGGHDAGVVDGPARTVVWRVLDAQYFGLAQRRNRVFVVASAGGRERVPEILLEFDGVRRDTAPLREAGQGVARSLTASTGGPSAKEQQLTFVADGRPLNALHPTAFHPLQDPICSEDLMHCLGGMSGQSAGAVMFKSSHYTRGKDGAPSSIAPPLCADADKGDQDPLLFASGIRRLTPIEFERLMGFPDRYTAISWRGRGPELVPDGPRFRVLGNSIAVPVLRWIGERIERFRTDGAT